MAKKSSTKKATTNAKPAATSEKSTGSPKYPYTVVPPVLKKLLKEIPQRPQPPKMTRETLKVWGVSASGSSDSAIRVLKRLGLLDDSGHPKPEYASFMDPSKGAQTLGRLMKETYRALFETSLKPLESSNEELKTFFNVHSGGGEEAMRLQIQTFKILAEFAAPPFANSTISEEHSSGETSEGLSGNKMPAMRVDLHIHLPDNKSSRDYEAIIQDIARYIYGRDIG